MKYLFLILSLLAIPLAGTFGQRGQSLYETQITYGLNLNTQAGLLGGLSARYAKRINERRYHSFSLELVEVKHPKEERLSSLLTGEFFVPGKQNYFFAIRPQYGQELVLFRKARERGVQVNALAAIGPTLGLQVPYVIIYEQNRLERRVQYDPDEHNFQFIRGSGTPFEALSDMEFNIGGSFKISALLEYSGSKSHVIGLETGLMIDAFANEAVIMPLAENRSVFSSIFVNLFYGFNSYD